MANLEIELLLLKARETDWMSQKYRVVGQKRIKEPLSEKRLAQWQNFNRDKEFLILKDRVAVPQSWEAENVLAALAVAGSNLVSKRKGYVYPPETGPKISLIIDEELPYDNKIGFEVRRGTHIFEGAMYLPGFPETSRVTGIPLYVREKDMNDVAFYGIQFFQENYNSLSPLGEEYISEFASLI